MMIGISTDTGNVDGVAGGNDAVVKKKPTMNEALSL